jgi:hypothetical protein
VNQIIAIREVARRFPRLALAITLAASALVSLLGSPMSGTAALPGSQGEIRCVAPKPTRLPTTTETGSAVPVASPVAGAMSRPVASPVAPPPAAEPNGAADIESLVRTIAVCQTESRVKTLSRFVTENFLGDMYAGGGRITKEQFVELAKDLPNVPVEIVSITNVEIDPDGRATAEVVSVVGRQLLRANWSFLFVPQQEFDATGEAPMLGTWWPDGVDALPVEPPANADVAKIELREYTYDPSTLRAQGPDIVLSAQNSGKEDHELLVLKLRDDVTTQDLLTAPGPELPRGVRFLGQVTVPAGADGQLVLVGMEPGTYAIVDLLINPDGTPHLALGMEATLNVR